MNTQLTPKQLLNREQAKVKKKIELLEKGTLLLLDTKQKAQQISIILNQEWDACNGIFISKQDIELISKQIEILAGNYFENFCLAGTFYDLKENTIKLKSIRKFL